jgi:hypothetical protein
VSYQKLLIGLEIRGQFKNSSPGRRDLYRHRNPRLRRCVPERPAPSSRRRQLSWPVTQEYAIDFAAERGYDIKDYIHGGRVADWWGFTWMILAEARGVLTPEKRAAAWCRHGEKTWWA